MKLKNLQYEGSSWGRGIYKGKLSSVETAARLGHPGPMILSLGHNTLPASHYGAPLPSLQACHPLLFGLQALRPFKVRRGPGALTGDQREAAGIARSHPGELADYGHFLPLWAHPPWGTPTLGNVISTLPYGRIPKCCLSKLPAPHPHRFKVQSNGVQGWGPLGPHLTLPPKEGERCPLHGNSCCSRAVGPDEEVQVSTGRLVLPTRLGLQVWPGTSCAGRWPGFSSGVPPE